MSIIHEAIIRARFFRVSRMRESASGPVGENFTRKKMVELLGRERIGTFVITYLRSLANRNYFCV